MITRRAALYIGGATLFVAWLSSAASLSQRGPLPAPDSSAATVSPAEHLAVDMQTQAKRLRQRLAAAPLPPQPGRNPFTFRETTAPRKSNETSRRARTVVSLSEMVPVEPALALIGVAEERRAQGVVRTAMISTQDDELIVAAIGDGVLQRYKVTAIGQDAVELADNTTGLVRRIALQYQ